MITVEVKGPLNIITGRKLVIEDKDVSDIKDLANYIKNKYYEEAQKKGFEPIINNFFSHNIILINDIEISALEGANTKISNGDRITILNFTHGG
jgi:molybdopterin converting factor small subunit